MHTLGLGVIEYISSLALTCASSSLSLLLVGSSPLPVVLSFALMPPTSFGQTSKIDPCLIWDTLADEIYGKKCMVNVNIKPEKLQNIA